MATDPDFIDKAVFSTMARTLGPFNKLAVFILEILSKYNWQRVAVVSSNYLLWLDCGKAIRKVFLDNNITIAYQTDYERFPPERYIQKTLKKIQAEARSEYKTEECHRVAITKKIFLVQ